jgi:hypothetical protein
MTNHSVQRFLKREEAAMRERGRIVMRGRWPMPIRPSSKNLRGSTRSSDRSTQSSNMGNLAAPFATILRVAPTTPSGVLGG